VAGQFNTVPYSTVTAYTVPAGQKFRLTDMLFTNYQSDPCDVGIVGYTYEIRIPPSSTVSINLQTGFTFQPGDKVTLENTWRLPGHGTNCEPIYTLAGYLYTVP
jgi:hypothetical protein